LNELDSLVGATYISHPRKGSEFFQASVVRASALPDGEGVAKRVDGSQKNGETEISVSGRRFWFWSSYAGGTASSEGWARGSGSLKT